VGWNRAAPAFSLIRDDIGRGIIGGSEVVRGVIVRGEVIRGKRRLLCISVS
jgi:hypothetical protein